MIVLHLFSRLHNICALLHRILKNGIEVSEKFHPMVNGDNLFEYIIWCTPLLVPKKPKACSRHEKDSSNFLRRSICICRYYLPQWNRQWQGYAAFGKRVLVRSSQTHAALRESVRSFIMSEESFLLRLTDLMVFGSFFLKMYSLKDVVGLRENVYRQG